MDRLSTQERALTPELLRRRVATDARQSFANGIDDNDLEQCVAEAVAGLWTANTRVTTFMPVLALREVREALERRGTLVGPR